jgi:hypothetical protein
MPLVVSLVVPLRVGSGERRAGAPEFLRAAPWERASPGPGSRGQPQNPILEHKARFYGVSVIFADPQNTSRACPVCGRVGERRRGPVRACPCGARRSRRAAAALFSLGRAFPGISPDAESGLEESARMGPPADAGGGPIPKARLADPRASRKGRRGRGGHEGGGEEGRKTVPGRDGGQARGVLWAG